MIKTSGAEFRRFYNDPLWEEGCYHDDVAFKINGKSVENIDTDELMDTDIVEFEGGFVIDDKEDTLEFEDVFKSWKKKQTVAIVIAEIPKDKLPDLYIYIKSISGEILS